MSGNSISQTIKDDDDNSNSRFMLQMVVHVVHSAQVIARNSGYKFISSKKSPRICREKEVNSWSADFAHQEIGNQQALNYMQSSRESFHSRKFRKSLAGQIDSDLEHSVHMQCVSPMYFGMYCSSRPSRRAIWPPRFRFAIYRKSVELELFSPKKAASTGTTGNSVAALMLMKL